MQQQPAFIKGLQGANVIRVSAGSAHTMCLTDSGKVFAFGSSQHGQLGLRELQNHSIPRMNQDLYKLEVTQVSFTNMLVL